MSTNSYHFTTNWRFRADVREVVVILTDAPGLARWWPAVYLDVHEIEPGGPDGLGKVISLYTKGWLPYTLRWQFRIVELRPDGFALEADGDFVGRGNWTFGQEGEWALVRYDWDVVAEKPLLRMFSFLLKPIFRMNHEWAMEVGRQSLELELQRRRTSSPAEYASIPAPPGPSSFWLQLLALLAGLAAGLYLFVRKRAPQP